MSVHEAVQRRLVRALDHPCRDLTRRPVLRGHNRRLALRPAPRPFQRLPLLVRHGAGGPCSVAIAVEGSPREESENRWFSFAWSARRDSAWQDGFPAK